MPKLRLSEETVKNPESSIDGLIDEYKDLKDSIDLLSKNADKLNKQIKEYFTDHNLSEHCTNKYKALVSMTQKESLDDDKAIEILREYLPDDPRLSNIICTKEYIDEDALISLIFEEQQKPESEQLFKAEWLEPAKKISNPIYSLRVNVLKEDK